MKRADTTKLLSEILYSSKLSGMGKYWSSEVTIDYGTKNTCRVDYMQFVPPNQMSVSSLEKGIFICYEVKSCINDFKSGFGQNFIGEKDYFVMPMELYKMVLTEIPYGVGVLVPIPKYTSIKSSEIYKEFETPTKFQGTSSDWKLHEIRSPNLKERKKSIIELLFCMLRSGFQYFPDEETEICQRCGQKLNRSEVNEKND